MTWTVRAGALILASVLALQVGACAANSDTSTPSTARPVPTPAATSPRPASPSDVASSAAVAAWRGMWQDMTAAAKTSDAQSPLLGRHAAGRALQQLMRMLATDRKAGVVTRGQLLLTPRVTKITLDQRPPMVLIADCGDDTNWLKYKQGTDQLQNDVPGGRHAMGGTVLQVNGEWKVAGFHAQRVGTC
jgi:hypothetical protein